MQVRPSARYLALSFWTWVACGGDGRQDTPTQIDVPAATAVDASDAAVVVDAAVAVDAGMDAQSIDARVVVDAEVDAGPPRVDCLTVDSGIACDDGVFCNGLERCAPAEVGADSRGCVPGVVLVCAAGQLCSEQMKVCSACSDTALDDADGDGHEAASCGGDDCRDDDVSVHAGGGEVCDGKDNDCDGVVDGALADAACVALAPSGSTSLCAGSCQITCTDPDADLVAGACVPHDDCAGVTSCGPGSCVDGVRSYTCSCPAGYSGTSACADVDECLVANDCDSSPAACVNTVGSHQCVCPDTHFGNGVGVHGCTRKAIAVAAGTSSTCALMTGGRVKCWGDNSFGKLGVAGVALGSAAGQMGDALPFVALDRAVVSLAVGSDVTCAVLADGHAKCWGYNGYGALGGGDAALEGVGAFDAPLPGSYKALTVAAGSGYGYALLDDGSIGRWGQRYAPYPRAPGTRFSAFDRSPLYDQYHLCAVLDAGAVACWPGYAYFGDDTGFGTLGPAYDDTLQPENRPAIALGRPAKQVALGNQHSCALLDDGSVKCWGRNDYGQLGLGDTVHRGVDAAQMGDALPAVALGGTVKAVAAGAHHSCALLETGAVKCWGLNDAGQLGQGTLDNVGDAPGEVAALPAVNLGTGRTAVAIDVGTHSCALLDNGAVKCWGANAHGELGQGDTVSRGSVGDALRAIDLGE